MVVVALVVVVLAGTSSAFAAAPGARATAQTYLDAMAHSRWTVVCQLLAPAARDDLLQLAQDDGHPTRDCERAAAAELFPELGRFPIVEVKVDGDVAWVVIGDAQISDSGNDTFRLRRSNGRWRVLDL